MKGLVLGTCLLALPALAAPKLGFQVYAVRDLCAKDFPATLRAAKALGYEGVETGRFYGRNAKELKALLDDVGLELLALQLYPEALVEPRLRETLKFAHEAGTRRINVAWFKGGSENEHDWQLMVDVVNHAAEVAAKEGIEIGYHNHDQEFRTRFEGKTACEWLFGRFSPLVKQEFDAGWCKLAGEDPHDWLKRHPHRNSTVHVMPAIADETGLKPGEAGIGSRRDQIDWKRLLAEYEADGVEWLVVKPVAFPGDIADLKACADIIRANGFAKPKRYGPWPKEKAWAWYRSHPWIRGCNYMSAGCANRVDQWQELGFEGRFQEAEKELALAQEIGFNSMRIVLGEWGFGVWLAEHDGFMERLERTIDQFDRHGMTVTIVLASDCSRPKEIWELAKPGPQTCDWGYHGGRRKSQHGSFPDAVGYTELDDPVLAPKFFEMVREVMMKYRTDRRILIWNLFNEPGNNNRGKVSLPHMKKLFETAWEIDPVQPLSSDIRGYYWYKPERNPAEKWGGEMSDVISYHCYNTYWEQVMAISHLKKRFDRPLFVTEWLNRIQGNRVEEAYPLYYLEGVGCYMWGFVAGKYQTYEPWEGMWKQVEEGKGEHYDFTKWMHDLIRPSLRPYDPKEVNLIRKVNELADRVNTEAPLR